MKTLKFGFVAVSSFALILTACPEVPNEIGTIPAKYTKIGLVGINRVGTGKSFSGVFYKIPTAIARPQNPSALSTDTCSVVKAMGSAPVFPNPGEGQTFTALDAGDKLTLTKGAITLAEVVRDSSASNGTTRISYNAQLIGNPDTIGTTLTIPGAVDGFPAMIVNVPNELIAFTVAPSNGISKQSEFTWTTPTTDANLALTVFSGSFSSGVFVACVLKDDGEFVFPTATQNEMDSKGFTQGQLFLAQKVLMTTKALGDALLLLGSTRVYMPSQQ